MARHGPGGLRGAITAEAARLMVEEGVKQYFTAKRIAAKRLLGRVEARRVRYRPSELPSNGEIRDAVLALAALIEGPMRQRRLFAMRITALRCLRALSEFSPRLIGSVSTGHIRRGSDIDLHVFTDDLDPLFDRLRALRWPYTTERVSILKGGVVREFQHVHVADDFEVELTVYERRELRVRPRSSTDGKPIVRVKAAALEGILATEHPSEWQRYLADGTVPDADAGDDDGRVHDLSTWDALCDDDPPAPEDLPTPDELAGDDAPYDPLPGFERV
jgi:hypothetical protein